MYIYIYIYISHIISVVGYTAYLVPPCSGQDATPSCFAACNVTWANEQLQSVCDDDVCVCSAIHIADRVRERSMLKLWCFCSCVFLQLYL